MKNRHTTLFCLGIGLLLTLAGCVPTGNATRPNPNEPFAESLEDDLRSELYSWWGTPYKLGGTTKRGIDCSGFVQKMYARVYNMPIARATAQQIVIGNNVGVQNLQTGDLVFFLNNDIRHVGLYLSNGEFAHASTSHGVRISKMSESYWANSFFTARRIVDGTVFDAPNDPNAEPRSTFGTVDERPQTKTSSSTSQGW